jgi:hypothetical protein
MTMNVPVPPSGGGFPAGLPGNRVTRGTPARFDETKDWSDRDGLPLPNPMLVVGYTTILRRWKDHKPEDKTEHPLPDPSELNAAIPIAEWEVGINGQPEKPWKLTYVVYLVDLTAGSLFTYANSTYGAMLAYTNLEEQIAVMRMLRGEHVFPIVRLERRPMKTAYGMKTRPHFHPIDWRAPGGSQLMPQAPTPQLPGPTTTVAPTAAPTPANPTSPTPAPTSPLPPAAATPAAPASTLLDHTKPVKPITVGELIADELPPWA